MRKIITPIVLVLCLLALGTSAYAAGTVYDLPELAMHIQVPDGWVTFTRDLDNSNTDLQQFGYDKDTLASIYLENNIYLNTISKDPFAEIIVTMDTSEEIEKAYDLNIRNDKELASMQRELIDKHTNSGASVSKYMMFEHTQALFVAIEYAQPVAGNTVYSKDFSTIINGQAINISLHSYDTPMTDDLSQALQQMVNSITFSEVTTKSVFNMTSILFGMLGIFFILAVVVFYKIRKSNGKKKTYARDVKTAFKNKYTRW